MKKLVSLVAAGLMIAGGALASAPAASAYPAGKDPGVRIVGANTLAPNALSRAQAFNFKPGCQARFTFTRAGSSTVLLRATRSVLPSGRSNLAFRAPDFAGRYAVRVVQVRTSSCAALRASTTFRVAS